VHASPCIGKKNAATKISRQCKGPVRFSYNPYFLACFFSRKNVFLSQQISRNSVSACFFSEANGAVKKKMNAAWTETK